jgi:NADPH-dependent 2,4-dienoyl-CoA reductase/sulfur reductase-like enzyme/rhodanese-related sulfurtransferase
MLATPHVNPQEAGHSFAPVPFGFPVDSNAQQASFSQAHGSRHRRQDVNPTEYSKRVVVIGASAAGLRCAARLARLRPGWSVTVLEQRREFSFAACGLPYVLSGDVPDVGELRKTSDGALRDAAYFASVKGVQVRPGTRAVSIDTLARSVLVESGETVGFDELVLAVGARPMQLARQPSHPRVHSLHTLSDLPPLFDALKTGKLESVVVVGGGACGCELAEAFSVTWGADVTQLEAADHVLPTLLDSEVAALVEHALVENKVHLHRGAPVDSIVPTDDSVTVYAGGKPFTAEAVVVAVGVSPAVELAASAGVALGPTGAIAVDERLGTSVPNVWACGDCIELRHAVSDQACRLPLGSLANRQGRLLADIIAGGTGRLSPAAGAVGLKVFDTNVARVGLTRAQALAAGMQACSAWWCGFDRAHYYPEAHEIALHLVYERHSERVLGVQAVGPGDVHKRIDTATQLILRGARLADLAALEHAYAPPYAPALDPLAVVAMVAQNQERGLVAKAPFTDLSDATVLDVRHTEETAARPVTGARVLTLPQERARANLANLAGKDWLVVCERGTRSAEVAGWLLAGGVRATYLGGGLRWRGLAGQ